MSPESEAKKRWMKENAKVFGVRVMRTTEKDIFDYLEGKNPSTEFKKGLRLLIAQEKEQKGETNRAEYEEGDDE